MTISCKSRGNQCNVTLNELLKEDIKNEEEEEDEEEEELQ